MPPNRRGAGKSGVNRPEAQPAPAPVNPPPAVSPAQQIPVAQPYVPQQQIPVAQPYVPPQQYVQPQYVQPQYVQPQYVQPQVAQPYVAPVAARPAARPPSRGAADKAAQEAQKQAREEQTARVLWEIQGIFGGTRPWVWLLATIAFLDGAGIVGLVGYLLFATRGRLMGPAVVTHLGSMFTAFILMISSMFLVAYARKMGEFVRDPTRYWLERSLAAQRSVWRFMALLTLFSILLVITLVVALTAGTVLLMQKP